METTFCILICSNWAECVKNLSYLATAISEQDYTINQIQQGIFNTAIEKKPFQFRCYPWTSGAIGLKGMKFWVIDKSFIPPTFKEEFSKDILGRVKITPLTFYAGDLEFK